MLPPLLKVLINEPVLLGEHIEAFTGLLLRDVAGWQARFQRRLLLNMMLVAGGVMSVALACIALMLWAATGTDSTVLVVVPLLPFTLAGTIYALQQPLAQTENFAASRAQLHADIQMLKEEMRGD
jgi:uncharacterized membrane protein YqjE